MLTILYKSTLFLNLWGEATDYAVQITIRMLTKSTPDNQSPYAILFSKVLNIKNIRT